MKKHVQEDKSLYKQKVLILSALVGVAVILFITVAVVMSIAGKKASSVTAESAIGSTINVVSGTPSDPTAADPTAADPAVADPAAPAATVPGTTGGNTGTTPDSGTTPNGGNSSIGTTPTTPGGASVTPTPAAAGGTGYVDSSGFIVDSPNNDSVPAPVIPNEPAATAGTNSTTPTDDDGLVVFPVIPASEL